MKRILVFGMTENPGGVESFLVNYYRHFDRDRIQLDFLCNTRLPVAYEEELTALGSRFFHITARRDNRRLFRIELEAVFRDHADDWDAIWVNVSSLANIDYLIAAKRFGIRRLIIHSHNSRNMEKQLRGALRGLMHRWNRTQIGKYATDFWACSEDAARWFYTKELMDKAVIIRNAIDVDQLKFDAEKRNLLRGERGWKDQYVIGNVGRLHFQKNQMFILQVFEKFHEKHPDSLLVLVGQGEDEAKLRRRAQAGGLRDAVVFVGVQKDVQAWLSSFDLFFFPSKFEGLPIAALEAEANGLPVLASRGVIPQDVRINENLLFFDLDAEADAWQDKMEEAMECGRLDYQTVKKNFIARGYDLETEANKLERLLTDGCGRDSRLPR